VIVHLNAVAGNIDHLADSKLSQTLYPKEEISPVNASQHRSFSSKINQHELQIDRAVHGYLEGLKEEFNVRRSQAGARRHHLRLA
jgi:hypothetical protein